MNQLCWNLRCSISFFVDMDCLLQKTNTERRLASQSEHVLKLIKFIWSIYKRVDLQNLPRKRKKILCYIHFFDTFFDYITLPFFTTSAHNTLSVTSMNFEMLVGQYFLPPSSLLRWCKLPMKYEYKSMLEKCIKLLYLKATFNNKTHCSG